MRKPLKPFFPTFNTKNSKKMTYSTTPLLPITSEIVLGGKYGQDLFVPNLPIACIGNRKDK